MDTDLQVWHEALSLPRPIAHHGGGRDDESGASLLLLFCFHREQGEQLQCLTQSHVIGQHCAELVTRHEVEPVDSPALVVPQLGFHRVWNLLTRRRWPVSATNERLHPHRGMRIPLNVQPTGFMLSRGFQGQLTEFLRCDEPRVHFLLAQGLNVFTGLGQTTRIRQNPLPTQIDQPGLGGHEPAHLQLR